MVAVAIDESALVSSVRTCCISCTMESSMPELLCVAARSKASKASGKESLLSLSLAASAKTIKHGHCLLLHVKSVLFWQILDEPPKTDQNPFVTSITLMWHFTFNDTADRGEWMGMLAYCINPPLETTLYIVLVASQGSKGLYAIYLCLFRQLSSSNWLHVGVPFES